MAIIKTAKNIQIKVTDSYHLSVGKKVEKIAQKINVEAQKNNLVLASNKKIMSHGNK
ncbi:MULTISPECIES: hypothetical protein [Chryseobacterium]|jgi:hypothetical protein|uniref:Uncharacterized protein n=2 Tax=Chryseobacterium TaxID=59732 RepID=A0A1M5LLX4_9FLAO|nr:MULTISPECIES: hypothetical protein [Chryseobacterium]MDN5397114.1 hypothetical protein [Chryseobacterium sp.]MDN5423052.1 hypothetical protein [Chryseobacterium sp.]MDN5476466.1 hypothetical protein [Chryseobacterium sp.]CEJ71362.1 hypothetical protein BN1195_03708 [Chryseobacterium oranimense G311]SHG65343.1 hypothetical protein SAMN05421866_1122 [Chryseobacterium oranimense]